MIKITLFGVHIPHSTMIFPGGEVQIKLSRTELPVCSVYVHAAIYSSLDVMELLMVTDALKRAGVQEIGLVMPYVPYARQDRVCAPGEALSLKVFCNLINSQGYSSVEVWDVHSDVTLALLDRVVNVPQKHFVKRVKPVLGTVLVAPDAGALKKIYDTASLLGCDVVRADKTRDPVTGKITGTIVHSYPSPSFANFLIVDDICDGGRTFIDLAVKLRRLTRGEVHLYVTHGIFSQGLDVFNGLIDQVYCPNVWPDVPDHVLLNRI